MRRLARGGFGLMGVVLVLPLAFSQEEEVTPGAKDSPDLPQVEKRIFTGTNEFRAKEDRKALKTNDKLHEAAAYFAGYLAQHDKLSHTADGKEPWERAAKYGYEYCIVLENIAYELNSAGFTTQQLADDFVNGWKKSPGHRKNMLDPDVTEIGVAVAPSATAGKYYAVQLFGRPKSDAIVFKVTNQSGAKVSYTVDDKPQTIEPRFTITHTVCRPPRLALQLSAEDKKQAADKVLRPANGDHYVIRNDKAGVLTVEKQ